MNSITRNQTKNGIGNPPSSRRQPLIERLQLRRFLEQGMNAPPADEWTTTILRLCASGSLRSTVDGNPSLTIGQFRQSPYR